MALCLACSASACSYLKYAMVQAEYARIQEVVRTVNTAANRPEYVYDLAAVRTLPPIMYPTTMVNTALNYREHALEMAGLNSGPPALVDGAPPPGTATETTVSAPGIWDRSATDNRWNPYMFLKSPSTVIADGEAIRLPVGRERVDWECELGAVIGRTASRVPTERAEDYIFGYTIEVAAAGRRPGFPDRERHAGLRHLVPDHGRRRRGRRVRPRGAGRRSLRLRLADRKVTRHVRPHGSLHRAEGVRRRSAGSRGPVLAER